MENQNKLIQKRRIIKYFIYAAIELIDEGGLSNITIRKIADKAGYNSATIYNYFENLDHLLLYVAINNLNEYIDALPSYIKYAKNSKEIYIGVWHSFIDYALLKPDLYYKLFISDLKGNVNSYFDEYYKLFPIDIKKYPDVIRSMLKSSNILDRNKILMDDCIKEGLVSEENGKIIHDLSVSIFESTMIRINNGALTTGKAKDRFLNYLDLFFKEFGND